MNLFAQVPLASGLSGQHVGDAGLIVGKYKLVVGSQYDGIGYWTGYVVDLVADREVRTGHCIPTERRT